MDKEIQRKLELRKNLNERLKRGDNNFIKINRCGIKEIQEWLKGDRKEKFDISHFQKPIKTKYDYDMEE